MVNTVPAGNVQAAAVAGMITIGILHICAANNIIIPQDVSDSISLAMPVIVAHLWDMLTGGNLKKVCPPVVMPVLAEPKYPRLDPQL